MLHRKICKTPGCNGLTYNRSGYCDKCEANYHRVRAPENKETPQWQTRKITHEKGYGTGRWKAFARMYLLEHPVCARCGAKAEVVDHKTMTAFQMVDAYGEFILDPAMYQPLCVSCNNKKQKQDSASDREYLKHKKDLESFNPGGGVETF